MRLGSPRPVRLCALVLLGLAGSAGPALAQPDVRLGGLVFLDYFYQLSSPDSAREDLHGFNVRRLYLTADAELSEAFSARARLETSDRSLNERGMTPFVKDLYLRWDGPNDHRVTVGITKPPVYDLVDDFWGYRSLERTLLNLNRITGSRDLGLRIDGPVPVGRDGLVRYAAMVANNEGVFPEEDQHKRGYGRLDVRPSEPLVFTLGGTLATFADERDLDRTAFAFAGYETDTWRAGLEGYLRTLSFETTEVELDDRGVMLFGVVELAERVQVVARVDRSRREGFAGDTDGVAVEHNTFGLLGLTYKPIPDLRLTPNVLWTHVDGAETDDVEARITVDFSF